MFSLLVSWQQNSIMRMSYCLLHFVDLIDTITLTLIPSSHYNIAGLRYVQVAYSCGY